MFTLRVTKAGGVVGNVRYDPATDHFDPDASVPTGVVSDIVVNYYRDNVLFGENGEGYTWAEVAGPSPADPPPFRTERIIIDVQTIYLLGEMLGRAGVTPTELDARLRAVNNFESRRAG